MDRPRRASASGPNQIPSQRPIELLHPNRHLHRVERILHHIIPIQLIAPPHHNIRIRLLRASKQQELDTRRRLKTRQAEVAGFEALDAGGGRPPRVGLYRRRWDGVYGARDGVNAVEGAGEDERVVGSEVLEAWGEGAVVHLQSEELQISHCVSDITLGLDLLVSSYQSAGFVENK